MSETTRVAVRTRTAGRVGPLAAVLLVVSIVATARPAYAAQAPVGLRTADSFAVLAGTGITNTGPTTIRGDVGTFPTPSETGFGSVTQAGTNHAGDAVTQGAKDDLVAAYNDAFGRIPVTNLPVELGGSTLLAGVYTSPTFGLTGTLTLDAQGDTDAQFIFKAGSTLIAETNSRVVLLNGADPCRVVWQVGSSASFRTGTQFVGDVLALTSITAETAATFQGRLLARNGAVTLDTNTITRLNCVVPSGGGTTTSTTPGATTPGSVTPTTPTAGFVPASLESGSPSIATGTPTRGLAGPPARQVSGPPTATPGAPGSPVAPPASPFTGTNAVLLVASGLFLVTLGALTRTGARRRVGTGH
jgi:hypothetical protein